MAKPPGNICCILFFDQHIGYRYKTWYIDTAGSPAFGPNDGIISRYGGHEKVIDSLPGRDRYSQVWRSSRT